MIAFVLRRRGLAGIVASSMMLALAGCASKSNTTAEYAAVAPPQAAAAPIAETEDDGLPAQSAPPAGIRDLPDDPNEPFSPNYGGANPAADGYEHYEMLPPSGEPASPAERPSVYRKKVAEAYGAH
jgi:hypothetical protein